MTDEKYTEIMVKIKGIDDELERQRKWHIKHNPEWNLILAWWDSRTATRTRIKQVAVGFVTLVVCGFIWEHWIKPILEGG